jgi:hypothetical protein
MSDQTISIKVKVNAETGQLEVLGQQFGKVSDQANKAQGAFKGLTTGASQLASTLGLALGGAAIATFFKSAITGAEQEAEAMRRLKFNVEGAGLAWDKHGEQIQNWINGIQVATRFSDSQAIDTLERLVRATGNVASAQKASEVAMGVSVKTGMSLGESTTLLTGLINGNERSVMQLNKEFGGILGPISNAQAGLDKLSEVYGKAATSGDTLTDRQAKLGNAFGNFKDQVGDALSGPLATLLGWMTKAVGAIDQVGLVFASLGAKAFSTATFISEAFNSIKIDWKAILTPGSAVTIDTSAITAAYQRMKDSNAAIDQESESQFNAAEDRKTVKTADSAAARLETNRNAQQKEREERDTKEREEQEKRDKKAQAVADENQKLIELQTQLDIQLAQLEATSLSEKMAVIDKETAAKKAANIAQYGDNAKTAKANATLGLTAFKQKENLAKAERLIHLETSLQIGETALQTLGLLLRTGEAQTKGEVIRAKAILALEKSIAIAKIWTQAAGAPGGLTVNAGLAAANTALLVAQFATQSRNIDQAADAFNSSQVGTDISRDTGNGRTVTDRFSGDGGGGSGGVYSTPSSSGSGSGGGTVINVGGVVLNLNTGPITTDNVNGTLRKIAEAAREGTYEAVQLAISLRNAADRNSRLAS